jgi:hypothetical protein
MLSVLKFGTVVSSPCFSFTTIVNIEADSSVSIVSDYGLDDRAIEVRSPAGAKGFFL